MTVRGHVTNGRLIVNEPTDLPDGTEVELVSVHDRERADNASSVPDTAPVWGDVTDEEFDAFLGATASARLVDELRGGDESQLVDTDILSEILRARNANVILRQRRCIEDAWPTLSVRRERLRGGSRLVQGHRSDRVDAFVAWLPGAELVGVDAECARLAGEIEGVLERVGRRVGIADVLIAATALRSGADRELALTSASFDPEASTFSGVVTDQHHCGHLAIAAE